MKGDCCLPLEEAHKAHKNWTLSAWDNAIKWPFSLHIRLWHCVLPTFMDQLRKPFTLKYIHPGLSQLILFLLFAQPINLFLPHHGPSRRTQGPLLLSLFVYPVRWYRRLDTATILHKVTFVAQGGHKGCFVKLREPPWSATPPLELWMGKHVCLGIRCAGFSTKISRGRSFRE